MKGKCCYLLMLFAISAAIVSLLLIEQNRNLKKQISEQPEYPLSQQKVNSLLFELEIKQNLFFKPLPLSVDFKRFRFFESQQDAQYSAYVIMVFDLTVCGKCLDEELSILQRYEQALRSNNIGILAIIGVVDHHEESQMVTKHQFGEISFPFLFEKPDTIYRAFKLDREHFLDSPFYLFASRNLNVLDVFKSPYMQPEELEKWLSLIINQREF